MVAYNFQKRFVSRIEDGTKGQTIRRERKRHARPGELLQLYTGMRTKHCSLIGTAWCHRVSPIRLDFDTPLIETAWETITAPLKLDLFAVADGFWRWRHMATFWRVYHPDTRVFSGILIEWSGFMAGKREVP